MYLEPFLPATSAKGEMDGGRNARGVHVGPALRAARTAKKLGRMVCTGDYKVVNDAESRSWPTETRCKLRGNIRSSMLITLQ